MTNNSDQTSAALRLIDRELWVLTAADGPRRGGLVATWISAASIDPQKPVLLAGLAPNHFTTELVQQSKHFAAHLLRPDQVELAWNFAKDSGKLRDKLAGLALTTATTGAPILADCLASCDCRVFARHSAGDRIFFWADVVAGQAICNTEKPLRELQFLQALTSQQREILVRGRQADIEILKPAHEAWRNEKPW